MNCECIYYSKNTGKDTSYRNYFCGLAYEISQLDCELEPVSLSVITEDVKCFKDFCDGGEIVTIPAGSEVVFACGKYHYMDPIRVGRRVYHPYFPVDHEVSFEDVTDFEPFNMTMENWFGKED